MTDRDLATTVVSEAMDPDRTLLKDLMTTTPETIEETASLNTALARMSEVNCRRLPVVDGRGGLVGVISIDDILQHLAEQLHSVGQLLGHRGPDVQHR